MKKTITTLALLIFAIFFWLLQTYPVQYRVGSISCGGLIKNESLEVVTGNYFFGEKSNISYGDKCSRTSNTSLSRRKRGLYRIKKGQEMIAKEKNGTYCLKKIENMDMEWIFTRKQIKLNHSTTIENLQEIAGENNMKLN